MSKDATKSVPASGNEIRKALLVGFLLLLLLIFAPWYWVERAQKDLAERSRAALLQQGLDADLISIRFDGRDGMLVANQDQAAQLIQAKHLVERVWGVRTVTSRATGEPAPNIATHAGPSQPAGVAQQQPEPSPADAGMVAAPLADTQESNAEPRPAPELATQIVPPAEPTPPTPLPTTVADTEPTAELAQQPPPPEQASAATAPPAQSQEPNAEAAPTPEREAQIVHAAEPTPPTSLPTTVADTEPAAELAQQPAATEQASAATAPPAQNQEPNAEPMSVAESASQLGSTADQSPGAEPMEETAVAGTDIQASEASPTPAITQAPAPVPDTDARVAEANLGTETLLQDWPDLQAAEDLQLEMQDNQVWLRGQVNSRADLDRIEKQFPATVAARHIQLDLRLAQRTPAQLAEYLNLVGASFRFRPATSHFGAAGERAMDRIAEVLESYPGIRLGLAGLALETPNPRARRIHARHRAGAVYRALLKRGVDGQQVFLADFASPFSPLLRQVPAAPSGPGQIQFFSLER